MDTLMVLQSLFGNKYGFTYVTKEKLIIEGSILASILIVVILEQVCDVINVVQVVRSQGIT